MNAITFSAITLISSISLAGCSSSSSTQQTNNDNPDLSTEGLSGTASSTMRLVSTQISFGSGRSRTTEYEYDNAGNLSGLSFDGITHRYTIDAQGKIVERDISFGGPPSTPADAYYYDPVGGLRRIDITNASGVRGIELYKFDGELATNYEFRILDAAVRPSQVDENTGQFLQKDEFVYENGRLIRTLIDDDGDGVVDKQRDYSYNPDGTLSTALESGASPSSFVYTYEPGACNNNWGNSTHDYFCVFDNR